MRLENVWFTYDGRRWILRNIDLEVESGESIFIMGPNSSGKTTLLKTMALIYKPSKGRVLVDGRDYWSLKSDERLGIRREITYVHEKPLFFPGTVLENLEYPLIIRGVEPGEARRIVLNRLKDTALGSMVDHSVSSLSSGIQQLLSIMRALLMEPKILILDEPLNHLDLENQARVIEVISSYLTNHNRALIVSTHNPLFASKLASKIYELREGLLKRVRVEDVSRSLAEAA